MTDIIYGCSLALKVCIILERFNCLPFCALNKQSVDKQSVYYTPYKKQW